MSEHEDNLRATLERLRSFDGDIVNSSDARAWANYLQTAEYTARSYPRALSAAEAELAETVLEAVEEHYAAQRITRYYQRMWVQAHKKWPWSKPELPAPSWVIYPTTYPDAPVSTQDATAVAIVLEGKVVVETSRYVVREVQPGLRTLFGSIPLELTVALPIADPEQQHIFELALRLYDEERFDIEALRLLMNATAQAALT